MGRGRYNSGMTELQADPLGHFLKGAAAGWQTDDEGVSLSRLQTITAGCYEPTCVRSKGNDRTVWQSRFRPEHVKELPASTVTTDSLCCLANIKTHCGRDVTGWGAGCWRGHPAHLYREGQSYQRDFIHHVTTTCSKWASFTSFVNDRILMDFNTPNLLLFDIYHASYRGKSTKQCILLEISLWIFHVLTWRSYLPQETARVWASGSRGSRTSGSPTQRSDMMIFVIFFFFFHCMEHLILQHFCVSCSVDWAPPTLQVAERARVLGSGLLAKGCQPNPQQFVGIFAQNRPEVWRETATSKLLSLGSI